MNCHRLNSPLNPRPMLPPLYHHEKTCEKMLKTKVPLDVEFNEDPASRQKSCHMILLKEGMAWKFLAGLTPFHQVEHHDMLRALSPDWTDQWEEAAKKGCQQHGIKAHSYSLKYRSLQWSVGKLWGGQIYLQGKGIFLLSIGLHYNTPLFDKKFRVFSWTNSKSGNWRWRSYPTLGSFWLHIHPHPHPQPKLQVPGTNQLRKKRLKRTWKKSRLISLIPTLRYNRPMNIHLECPCS